MMELDFELSSELELNKAELDLIINDYFDVNGDNVICLNEFYYCYEKVKKYLKENGGSHQNLLSATYLIASNISSNVFFVDFANATTKDAEIRNLFLAAKCKCLEEIITDALNETCKSVDKSKVRELVRRD